MIFVFSLALGVQEGEGFSKSLSLPATWDDAHFETVVDKSDTVIDLTESEHSAGQKVVEVSQSSHFGDFDLITEYTVDKVLF